MKKSEMEIWISTYEIYFDLYGNIQPCLFESNYWILICIQEEANSLNVISNGTVMHISFERGHILQWYVSKVVAAINMFYL